MTAAIRANGNATIEWKMDGPTKNHMVSNFHFSDYGIANGAGRAPSI